MLNYTLNEDEEKSFILYLSFERDEIHAHMANNKIIRYQNTKENLDMLFNIMKEQVKNSDKFSAYISNSMKKLDLVEIMLSIGLCANLYVILSKSSDSPIASGIFEGLGGTYLIFNSFSSIECRKLLNDLKKNKLFVFNEELFTEENLFKYPIRGLNKRISKFLADKKCITINDMDDISYRDFKKLYKYLKKGKCRVRGLGK